MSGMLRTAMAFTVVLILAGSITAEIPRQINYQGMLIDKDSGEPLAGTLPMTFRLYDDQSAGSLLWTESQGVTANSEGVFSAILGEVTPVDVSFQGSVWLEVEVDGEILLPRRHLTSVPYSFYAQHADSAGRAEIAALSQDSDSLGGYASGEFIMKGEIGVITGEMIVGGADSGLDADMLDGLHADAFSDTGHHHDDRYFLQDSLRSEGTVNDAANPVDWSRLKNVPAGFADGSDDGGGGSGDGHSLDASDGSPVDAVYVNQSGEVGIGTTDPDDLLHIYKDTTVGVGLTIENPNTGASSAERIVFKNEDGAFAGITAYDDNHASNPGRLLLYNNRPDGVLGLAADGTIVATIKDGNLGVLQSDPLYRLDVNGIARVSGFTMATGAGTGKVLTSDPTGYATWQAPAAQPDGDWTVDGDDLLASVSGNVCIGDVESNQMYPIHIRRDTNDFVLIEIENQNTGMSSAEGILFRHEGGGTSLLACYDDDNVQYPGQMVLRSGKGSRQLHIMSHLKTCMFADSSGYVSIGRIDPENLLHVEGPGTQPGGVTGYGEVSARVRTTGGSHSALAVDAIADRDAIVYLAEDGDAVWDLRNDDSDGSKFQLRYHGGIGLSGKFLTVDSTGNAGIGTIYPDQKLHIYENSPGEVSYGLKLDNPGETAETSTGILFKVDGGGSGRGKGALVYERIDTWNRGDFHILQNDGVNSDQVGLGDEVMTIRHNGCVGIGTTIPSSKFEVQSTATSGRLCFFKQSSGSNAADVIRAETAGSGNALSGSSQGGRGVVGHSATDYAGYFSGDVYVSGSINKAACAFVIDHPLDPENKILRHNCVESPEHLLIYRGKVSLNDDGEGFVEMVDYFDAVARAEEASIHLTSVGRPFLTGAQWSPEFDGFTVYGEANREVFWEVLAERDDPVVRQIALPVEEDKGPENKLCDRGELLNPAAYGYPEAMGRDYELLRSLSGE
jgi:hypothetical protein